MINIGYRLERVHSTFYEVCPSNIIVIEELADDGRAAVTFTFQEGKEYIRLLSESKPLLKYCKNPKCADGIIFELESDQSKACLHIIELKTGIGTETWEKVKGQFYGASLRALAFATTIGISQITRINYYTAYVEDEEIREVIDLEDKKSELEGTIYRKTRTGLFPEELKEWQLDKVKVFENEEEFSHRRIPMSTVEGISRGSLGV